MSTEDFLFLLSFYEQGPKFSAQVGQESHSLMVIMTRGYQHQVELCRTLIQGAWRPGPHTQTNTHQSNQEASTWD